MALTAPTFVGRQDSTASPSFTFPTGSLTGVLLVFGHSVSTAADVELSGAGGTWTKLNYVDAPKYCGIFHVTGFTTGSSQTLTIASPGTVMISYLWTYDEAASLSGYQSDNKSDAAAADMSWTKAAGDHILLGGSGDNNSSQVIGGSPTPTQQESNIFDGFLRSHIGYYTGTSTSGTAGWDDGDTVFAGQNLCVVVEDAGGGADVLRNHYPNYSPHVRM
jgi:hypothetical protein